MAYASVGDVQARLNRPLTDEEHDLAEVLLEDVEAIIRSRIPDLDERAESEDYLALVVMVEANAALRVIRNPEGYRQEAEGNYSYSLSAAVAAGHLFVMDSEWQLLGATRGAFTIVPHLEAPKGPPLNWWETSGWGRCW